MSSTQIQGEALARKMQNLVAACGVRTTVKWCPYGQAFHAWVPRSAAPVIEKVRATFANAGLGVEQFDDPANDALVQIDGYI